MDIKLRAHNAIRMGENNLAITLPRIWVYSNNIRPGDRLSMSIKDDGTLVISKEVD